MKKFLIFMGISIGVLMIFIVSLSIKITYGFDFEEIDYLLSFIPDLRSTNAEIKLLLILTRISQYSHFIITCSIIIITIFTFILINFRRNKNNE